MQTNDFFTPVVDDPYEYGQIAAANSLSDIYAMGATPLTALNIVGFPIGSMDNRILSRIIQGGQDKADEAGVRILGGHSVKDPEIKYGLAVTGTVHPDKIVRNSSARPGDKIILTKRIGTGILTTALKNEKLPEELLDIITVSMKKLNRTAAEIMLEYCATACTDVSGFGLLGHLQEMTAGSGTTAIIYADEVMIFPQVLEFIEQKQVPGGLKENLAFLEQHLRYPPELDSGLLKAFCDPQTSGGLLFTIDSADALKCLKALQTAGITEAAIIGEITVRKNMDIEIV